MNMPSAVSLHETQLLRAFIDSKKRDIQKADHAYDLQQAASLLAELARPLTHPAEHHACWKREYLDQFYRDVVKFLFSFVTVHLLPGFSATQRETCFDVFFLPPVVPPSHSISALIAQITTTKLHVQLQQPQPQPSHVNELSTDESAQVLTQSVRLLQRVLDDHHRGVRLLIDQLIHGSSSSHVLAVLQPIVSSLCSVPDLVYNRLERATPQFFSPRAFHVRMCQQLLDALLDGEGMSSCNTVSTATSANVGSTAAVFRVFTEKLARIGAIEYLVRAWLSRKDLYDRDCKLKHAQLITSLPASAYEAFLLQLAGYTSGSGGQTPDVVVSSPQYLLLSYFQPSLCHNKQFQYAVAHKVLLSKPVRDFLFLRMLVDVLCQYNNSDSDPTTTEKELPLCEIFDVLVNRWSGDAFPLTADFALNNSVTFFLRFAMTRMSRDVFAVRREWTMKLCKGVQHHMAHSVERVRLLGMRVGESVSLVMSPEKPLDFEIDAVDPVSEYARVVFDFTKTNETLDGDSACTAPDGPPRAPGNVAGGGLKAKKPSRKAAIKKLKGLALVDPDEVVDSDDEYQDIAAASDSDSGFDSDADSDASLDAYDLADDEEDLKAQRPVYIKDLLAGLHADDDREKTETALAEAESLLRRAPKDLHFSAQAVVTALLRIEDKFNTPNFATLRAKALAAACALSPTNAVPYLQKQALEKEQLLQSRLDVLHALTAAAQELSETGTFRPSVTKSLLGVATTDTMETRTMQSLKTRRFGYKRDPLAPAKKNAFADHALAFFSPLLFGYVEYARQRSAATGTATGAPSTPSEVDDTFLAHLLHALSGFVECAGHAPQAVPMAKCLMEFAWHHRTSATAAVRRQVLFAFSRVVLVMPPFMLRQELGSNVVEMLAWLHETNKTDPDDGCREACRLLLSSGVMPMLSM